MTPEQRAKRIHKIVYSCDDRAELAERIVALEYENAKMQELLSESSQANEKLLAELRRYKSIVHARYSQPVTQLMDENAKLRELCAEMFEAVKCCCGEWCTKTASNCDNNECGWHKCYVALRELRIEV